MTGKALLLLGLLGTLFWGVREVAYGGPYLNAAHGNSSYGVNRLSISTKGYARGNCAHCHEQHGSIDGAEPSPTQGTPSPFALFLDPFSGKSAGPYTQSDNFCFLCHSESGSQQTGGIINLQYSNTFGGYTTDSARDIFTAFNLTSYHNLKDIQRFASQRFPFFKDQSDPCVACHNPHLARRNKANRQDPAYTAISRPADHESLWGDDANERMNKYTTYRSPYYYDSNNSTYEPGGTLVNDGSLTPDYVTFCLDCHQYEVSTTQSSSMNPNTPSGYLTAINWGSSGDMHGQRPRINDIDGNPKGFGTVKGPYNKAPVSTNYVLSCLDCHEPHGSILYTSGRPSTYLLRKEVNGNRVTGCGPAGEEYFCEEYFCGSCHTYSHCGGPNGCFQCHYHGAKNQFCAGPWYGPNF